MLIQKIISLCDRVLYYLLLGFGPVAFFGQARGMSVYVPLLGVIVLVIQRLVIQRTILAGCHDSGPSARPSVSFDRWGLYSLSFIGLYGLASSLWSPSLLLSLNAAGHLLPLIFGILILIFAVKNLPIHCQESLTRGLAHGYIMLILTVTIDIISLGTLSNWQSMIAGKAVNWNYTHSSPSLIILCCFIWPTIIWLRRTSENNFAVVLFMLVVALTFVVQHVSARSSIIIASLVFIVVYKSPRWMLQIITAAIISYLLLSPIIHSYSFKFMVDLWYHHLFKVSHLSALHRLYIWSYVSDLIMQKPIFGWGLSAAKYLGGQRHHLPPHFFELLPNHPHNGALHIWLDLGLMGIVAFCLLISRICRYLLNINDRFNQAAASAATAATLTIFSVSFGVWQSWWLASIGLLFVGLMNHGELLKKI